MAVRPRPALDTSPPGPRKEDEEEAEAQTKPRTAKKAPAAKNKARST
jgi:hypothetical protein